jgi:hypothetical protein
MSFVRRSSSQTAPRESKALVKTYILAWPPGDLKPSGAILPKKRLDLQLGGVWLDERRTNDI